MFVMTMCSLYREIKRAIAVHPVEVVAPRRPREGVDSIGCIICIEDLTEDEVGRIKASFKMERKRIWVVQRSFKGRTRRCLIVHFNLVRKVGRLSAHLAYEPHEEFADWLVRELHKGCGLSVWVKINRTEDVRGCLA